MRESGRHNGQKAIAPKVGHQLLNILVVVKASDLHNLLFIELAQRTDFTVEPCISNNISALPLDEGVSNMTDECLFILAVHLYFPRSPVG